MKTKYLLMIILLIVLTGCRKTVSHTSTIQTVAVPVPAPPPVIANEPIVEPVVVPEVLLDAQVLAKEFSTWYNHFVRFVPGKDQAFVDYIVDERGTPADWVNHQAVTVSEAHGYGMVLLAQMAQITPEQDALYHDTFDQFVAFYLAHPSDIDNRLMCWQMMGVGYDAMGSGTLTDVINTPNGADSATDGDLDVAYGLILADSLWGSAGTYDYATLAKNMLSAILENEVTEEGYVLLGDWVGNSSHRKYVRGSDLMLRNFAAFKAFDTEHADKWDQVLNQSKTILLDLYQNATPDTGLIPDFINTEGGFHPVDGQILESPNDGDNNYNACRTPWRIGQYMYAYDDPFFAEAFETYNQWITEATSYDPKNISAGYNIPGGTPIPGRNYWDMSFVAPMLLPAQVSADWSPWYNLLLDSILNSEIGSYYGDTIRMQVLIDASGLLKK